MRLIPTLWPEDTGGGHSSPLQALGQHWSRRPLSFLALADTELSNKSRVGLYQFTEKTAYEAQDPETAVMCSSSSHTPSELCPFKVAPASLPSTCKDARTNPGWGRVSGPTVLRTLLPACCMLAQMASISPWSARLGHKDLNCRRYSTASPPGATQRAHQKRIPTVEKTQPLLTPWK